MPTHLGTNPHNHVKHYYYSCSTLENFIITGILNCIIIKYSYNISYNNSKQIEVFISYSIICLNETILTCKFRRY